MIKKVILLFLLLVSFETVFAQSSIEAMVKNMEKIGAFDVMLFILFLVFFFALFSKSKAFGNNPGIAAVIAVIAAFLLAFVYPVYTGFSLIEPFARFFTQLAAIAIIFIFAIVIGSVFYPDLPKVLAQHMTNPTVVYLMIPIIIFLLVVSRVISVFWAGFGKVIPGAAIDIVILVAGLIIFVVILLVAVAMGGKK